MVLKPRVGWGVRQKARTTPLTLPAFVRDFLPPILSWLRTESARSYPWLTMMGANGHGPKPKFGARELILKVHLADQRVIRNG